MNNPWVFNFQSYHCLHHLHFHHHPVTWRAHNMTWPQPPPPPVTTIQWHGRPVTWHGHNHPICVISMAQTMCCLGLGMFFFTCFHFFFTNKFILYLLTMPWWCPTGAIASTTTTTIRWHGGLMTCHSRNNQWPNAMAHHHHLYHHHPVMWQACDMIQPQHWLSHQPKQHIVWALVCFFFFFFFSFPFILFY